MKNRAGCVLLGASALLTLAISTSAYSAPPKEVIVTNTPLEKAVVSEPATARDVNVINTVNVSALDPLPEPINLNDFGSYSEAYQYGYQEGHTYGNESALKPLAPLAPLPRLGESGAQDGYNRGLIDGYKAKQERRIS